MWNSTRGTGMPDAHRDRSWGRDPGVWGSVGPSELPSQKKPRGGEGRIWAPVGFSSQSWSPIGLCSVWALQDSQWLNKSLWT